MLNRSEFLYQRHLEIWKDQNKHIKRVILATLIFGFLILIRVLIPLNEKTLQIQDKVNNINNEIKVLEKNNESSSKLKDSFSEVRKFIQDQPWEREKENLIRKFRTLNRSNRNTDPQGVADKSIERIVYDLRTSIIQPLERIFVEDSAALEFFPEIRRKIDEFSSFINSWESNHLGRNWFGTISEKNIEMYRLTQDVNQRTDRLSATLNSKINSVTQKISSRQEQIEQLNKNVTDIQEGLEEALEEILPNWLQGVIRVKHMVQLYPFLLLIMVLYAVWLSYSITRHYSFVKNYIELSKEDLSDNASASLWTLTVKSRFGILLTTLTYGLFFIIVWILFERGWRIFVQWASVADSNMLLFHLSSMRFGTWIGRLLFALLLLGIVFLGKYLFFKKYSDNPRDKHCVNPNFSQG
ncbi:MAG: hypothetical protein SWO11_20635 [Thermodesulfobacteriota bacterium]|nr:hypothetical protein [Thermodesulfobacteriota bacterium]